MRRIEGKGSKVEALAEASLARVMWRPEMRIFLKRGLSGTTAVSCERSRATAAERDARASCERVGLGCARLS
jgi:hypothetical protein